MIKHKIIKIKRSKKYSDLIIIYLENKSVFRIPEDAFVLAPKFVGDFISNEEIELYGAKMRLQETKDAAYRLLSYRMRSVAELEKRLKLKEFNEIEISFTIDYLIKLDYLNDKTFAKAFVQDKVKNKKIGPIALRVELIQHKLETEVLEKTIIDVYKKYDLRQLIISHLIKKKVHKNSLLNVKERNRLDNYLKRKGFYWDSIIEVYQEWGII